MSILPGWARNSGVLPPWYGPGGARGASTGPATALTTSVATPPPVRNIRSRPGMAGGATTGGFMPRVAGTKSTTAVNTGPVNPWLETGQDTGLVDSILSEMRTTKAMGPKERVTAANRNYQRSGELDSAITGLKDWMQTGGFSDADLSAIRARGVSPIRAVYANAQRNMERQRALQGGYAPGMNSAISRMAREMSEQLASKSTDIEADIAEKVQAGKQAGLNKYSDIAANENSLIQQIMEANAAAKDAASRFNATSANQIDNDYFNNALRLADLRHNIIESGRRGKLSFEDLNQRGGLGLIEAMMSQYGGR